MSDDSISRQAAIDALGDMVMNWTDSDYELGQLNQWKADRKAIIDLPSEQPERIKGKWIDCGYEEGGDFKYHVWRCSECGDEIVEVGKPQENFCAMCGARMEEEEDETD